MVRVYDIQVEALASRPPPRASESFNSSLNELKRAHQTRFNLV